MALATCSREKNRNLFMAVGFCWNSAIFALSVTWQKCSYSPFSNTLQDKTQTAIPEAMFRPDWVRSAFSWLFCYRFSWKGHFCPSTPPLAKGRRGACLLSGVPDCMNHQERREGVRGGRRSGAHQNFVPSTFIITVKADRSGCVASKVKLLEPLILRTGSRRPCI